MDAKEFFEKVNRICEESICDGCPLGNADLGCSRIAPENIDYIISEVENYKLEEESNENHS